MLLRSGELSALLLGAVALFLFLALFSYEAADPGWANSGWSDNETVKNRGGILGAWLVNLLYWILGYTAWLIPTILFAAGLSALIRREVIISLSRILRIVGGWILSITALAALFALNGPPQVMECGSVINELPCGNGGVIGHHLGLRTGELLGPTGGRLILLACVAFGLSVSTGISWLAVVEKTGMMTLRLLFILRLWTKSVLLGVHRWYLRRRQNRLLYSQQHKDILIAHNVEEIKEAEIVEPVQLLPLDNEEQQDSVSEATVKPLPSKSRNAAKAAKPRRSKARQSPPSTDLLENTEAAQTGYTDDELQALSRRLENKLKDFGIEARVESVLPGPVITRFEILPAAGIKVSRITALAKDLARSLAVKSVRVVEVVPGKSVIGIEIPNENRSIVMLRDLLTSDTWKKSASALSLALGQDIAGEPVVASLDKMPHLLVAGTTGSGKSMGINAMLLSILFKSSPSEVRLILVDPKMLELSVYEGIPHLLTPVITDMKKAASGLRWCVGEMERRYRLMAKLGVRNLAGFNQKVNSAIKAGEPLTDPLSVSSEADSLFDSPDATETVSPEREAPLLEPMPFIVVIIDEFADMMMIVGKKVEELITRLAQKARAAGIHLILATQRPSVDVITGLIKANIPTRISFQVSTRVDARTILDQMGAEQLLGHGDMLYLAPGSGIPVRVHGAYVSDEDIERATNEWKQRGSPEFLDEILNTSVDPVSAPVPGMETLKSEDDGTDELYQQALQCVLESRRASASFVQRRLRIGYNRAARLLEQMEEQGVVSAMGSNGNREVLAPAKSE